MGVLRVISAHLTLIAVSVLESLHLRHFFDKISLSYNVGCEKPDINIFKHALHSNIRPEEVLFVGDEYKACV